MLTTFIAAIPGLMVIVVILGCVMGGVTTATEAAAIAVAYSLLLTSVIYRTMSKEKLIKSLKKASKTTGVILLLIGVSNMLRWQMAYLEIPDAIEAALLHATTTPWLMLLYINIIQIFLGIFLDMAAHILITTPLFLPLAIQMGVGPVQFGMMLLLNCALGLVHPPVGTVQFVGCAIGNISIGEATKTAWPYYLAIWIAINLVTYVPSFSTWLPSIITGHPVFLANPVKNERAATSALFYPLMQLRFTSRAVASLRKDLYLQECAHAGRTKEKGAEFLQPPFAMADVLTWRQKLRVQQALPVLLQQPSQPSSHASWRASSWA